MTTFIEMTFEEWKAKYNPIYNHLDTNASFQDESGNGIMFETYKEELEFVRKQEPHTIWTFHHGDNNCSYISSGYHLFNRLGYFITANPWNDGEDIQIVTQEDNYMCENCETEYYENVDFMYDYWGELYKCPKCATIEETKEIEDMVENDKKVEIVATPEEVDEDTEVLHTVGGMRVVQL